MSVLLDVLLKVTLPIIALVAVGYVLQGRLKLDVSGLNRLQVFVVLPCFLIHFLSTASQPISAVWPTVVFTVVQLPLLIAVGWLVGLAFGLPANYRGVLALTTSYANVGFFGIPLVQLAFPPEFILHQSVITSLVSIMIVTAGVWLLAPPGAGLLGRLKQAFDTPIIPAVIVGLLLRGFEITLPPVLGLPIQMLGSIFTPLALYTLGAQLAEGSDGEVRAAPMTLALVLKLLAAPALTWALALAMGMPPDLTALFVVAASTPVGVLLGVFASEFNKEPRFVASAILISTALSPLFVTGWLLLMRFA